MDKTWLIDLDSKVYFDVDMFAYNSSYSAGMYKITFKNTETAKYFENWFHLSQDQKDRSEYEDINIISDYKNLSVWNENKWSGHRTMNLNKCEILECEIDHALISVGWFDDVSVESCDVIAVIKRDSKINSIIK